MARGFLVPKLGLPTTEGFRLYPIRVTKDGHSEQDSQLRWTEQDSQLTGLTIYGHRSSGTDILLQLPRVTCPDKHAIYSVTHTSRIVTDYISISTQ